MNGFENKLNTGDKNELTRLNTCHVLIALACYLKYVDRSSENLWKGSYLNLIMDDDVTLDRNGTRMDQCSTN